jgi:hypothetical protein
MGAKLIAAAVYELNSELFNQNEISPRQTAEYHVFRI